MNHQYKKLEIQEYEFPLNAITDEHTEIRRFCTDSCDDTEHPTLCIDVPGNFSVYEARTQRKDRKTLFVLESTPFFFSFWTLVEENEQERKKAEDDLIERLANSRFGEGAKIFGRIAHRDYYLIKFTDGTKTTFETDRPPLVLERRIQDRKQEPPEQERGGRGYSR